MSENFTNFYSSQVMAAVDGDDPFMIVLDAAGAPSAPQFRVVVQDGASDITNRELMLVTNVLSGTTFQVTRGIEGTSGVSHVSGSFVAHVLTAGVLAELQHDDWADYTPTWTAVTTNPTLGNGTLSGRYKMLDSKTVAIQIHLIFGSTSTAGSGNYSWALPSVTSGPLPQIIAGFLLDSSTGNTYVISGRINASNSVVTRAYYDVGVAIDHNSPFVWAVGDTLNLTGIVELE